MDSGVTLPTTTAPTTGPLKIHSVVVFGDSLSDIGKKWTSTSGRAGRLFREMFVSPTGRFSDCRNWTDFMFEAATGLTLISSSKGGAMELSERHFSVSGRAILPIQNSFLYANYAEGGACGDKPASKEAFLGTFKEQVDAFEKDCTTSRVRLGNTLFIIWFGANDLYTANRKAEEMSGVAQEIAVTQRNRLAQWVRSWNTTRMGKAWQSRFIFVDLCRPLTSVRYTKRLQDAEAAVKAKLGAQYVAPTGRFLGGISQARDTFRQGIRLGHLPGDRWYGADNRMEKLRAQIVEIKRLENGVLLFNATLKKLTHQNGDRLAEVSWCVSEETVQKLVQGNHRLKAGAMDWSVWSHISANDYSQKITSQNITTIDEVHPTDEMYRLLWLEIYEQIKRSGCTFGQLNQVAASTPLATLAGPAQPSPQTRQLFDAVMTQLTGGEED